MTSMTSKLSLSGALVARKISITDAASFGWRLRQWIRPDRIKGLIFTKLAHLLSRFTGIVTMTGQLRAIKIDGITGRRTNLGVVSRRLVTTVFVNDMVDELIAETTAWGDYKFHDSGEGVTAANVSDTDIETTDGEARATGSQVEQAANIYRSVGTITYTTTKAITEHGLFNIVTGGILMDRHTFTAINVVATDQIEFTYDLTCTAGG